MSLPESGQQRYIKAINNSNSCGTAGEIFFSRVDFLCWLLFRYPFHPRVTTVARKKSRSFCQKCRWQVTAKHAYTLRIEPCFGIGHNLSLICQMTSEDIKHQLNNNNSNSCQSSGGVWKSRWTSWAPIPKKPTVSVDVIKATLQQQLNEAVCPRYLALCSSESPWEGSVTSATAPAVPKEVGTCSSWCRR